MKEEGDHFSKMLAPKIVKDKKVQGLNFDQFVEGTEIPKLTYEEGNEIELT